MKKLLIALAFLFAPSAAFAQCNGIFPTNTLCGNTSGSPAPPSAVAVSSLLAQSTTPEQFGALCNGTGDDGPAIQNAINSVAGPIRVIFTSGCTYRVVTSVSWSKDGVALVGGGMEASKIDFEPGANRTLFNVAGVGISYFQEFRNLWVYSTDITFQKKMFVLSDISATIFENNHCGGSSVDNTPLGGSSTCFQTNGRELTVIRKSTLAADQPIFIGKNPHFQSLSADLFSYENLNLIGTGAFPCITVEDGAGLSNTSFYKVDMEICTYGFILNDTTSVSSMTNVAFRDVRIEQSSSPTSFSIYISQNPGVTTLRGLLIENSAFDPGQKNILLRGVVNATITNNFFICSPATVAIDFGGGNTDAVLLLNNFFGSPCTIVNSSGTPMVKQWGTPPDPTGSPTLSASAFYLSQRTVIGMYNDMIQMPKITTSGAAPGAGFARLELVAGTNAGTCKLIAYAGTSATPATILDNIGGGC